MHGNDYNLLQTMFTIGYCLGNLPSQLAMTRIRPSLWLPTLELIWGFLVMAMAAARNVRTLYALRFLIGFLEASAYPGIMTLLGNWYTPHELGKRTCIFISSAFVSQMFSGYLQAGLYAGMDGRHGLRAWQWLFIFDGVIGVPAFLWGFFAVPDSPTNTRAAWLKPRDREIAVRRMEMVGRRAPGRLSWSTVRDIATSWPVYLFTLIFTAQILGIRVINYFAIYLKESGRYSVAQVNIIPTAGYGFQTGLTLVYAWVSDGIQMRHPVIAVAAGISLVGCVILSVYPEDNHVAMMAGWILAFGQAGSPALILSWLNEILSFSTEHRLVVIGVMETVAFSMNAWVILFTYPSGEAPRFSIGYQMACMFFAVEILAVGAIWYCNRVWKPKHAQ